MVILLYALRYQFGIAAIEGTHLSFLESLHVVVAGDDVVGSTVTAAVTRPGLSTTVIDIDGAPSVDSTGETTDRITPEETNLSEARSLVLAVSDDRTALFGALVAKQVAPEVEIIARANHAESPPKLYRAGAEYVLSLPTVSGCLTPVIPVARD